MQLIYHILWFEDQIAQAQDAGNRIRSAITRLGFEPKITFREVLGDSTNPAGNLPDQSEVDLVLMDWKLGGDYTGDVLAQKVRAAYRDKDIVFYSSETQERLRELIYKQKIDGVRCVYRPHLSDRVIGIIRGQLRRTLDLNHMRGLVMAATSDLDHVMIECLKAVQKVNYRSSPKPLADLIASQVAAQLRSKATAIEKMGSNGRFDKLLNEPFFSATLRHTILLAEVKKLADQIEESHLIEDLDKYPTDVIRPRNAFAHRKANVVDGAITITGCKDAINQSAMTELRLRLISHNSSLNHLLSLLIEMGQIT